MALSPSIIKFKEYFNKQKDLVKSPRSIEPLKSDFGLNDSSPRINENILDQFIRERFHV